MFPNTVNYLINYIRFETYTNRNDVVVSDYVSLPNPVVLDTSGAPHNLVPITEIWKVNYEKRLIRLATN